MAPFRCQKCGKSFLTLEKFTIHNYSHSKERPFKCSKAECGKAFVSKYKLMRHMATHSPVKAHQCTHCEKTFNRKDHLKNHLQTHDPNKISYVCEDCGKKYHTLLGYKRHMALHSASSGDLTCGVCTLELGSTEVLLDHLKSHAEEKANHPPREKKHQCDHCERCFYTRKDVRRHLVVHTGCKDFLCQFCAQRFGRKDHLTRHTKKTHSQELMQGNMQAGEYQGNNFQPVAPVPVPVPAPVPAPVPVPVPPPAPAPSPAPSSSFQIKSDVPHFQFGVAPETGFECGFPLEVQGLMLAPPEQVFQPMLPMQPMPEQPFALHPGVVPTSPPPIILQEHKFSPVPTSYAPFVGMPVKADDKGFCNMGFFEEFPLQEPQSPLKFNPCFEMPKEGFGKVTLPKELLLDAVNITIPASLEISSLLGFWQIPPPTPQNGFVNSTIPMGAGEPLPHRITCLAQQQPPPLPPPPPLPLPQPLPQPVPQLQPQFQLQFQPQPPMQPPMQLPPLQLQLPPLPPQLQLEPEPELEEEEEEEEEEPEEEEEAEEEAEPEAEGEAEGEAEEEEEEEEDEDEEPDAAQIVVSAMQMGQPPLPPTPHVFTAGANSAILPHFHHAFR